jgi:hypothetical protein
MRRRLPVRATARRSESSRMAEAKFRVGRERAGWTTVWIVGDQDRLLNTEPVCAVPSDYHGWFLKWLEAQSCPYPTPPKIGGADG